MCTEETPSYLQILAIFQPYGLIRNVKLNIAHYVCDVHGIITG